MVHLLNDVRAVADLAVKAADVAVTSPAPKKPRLPRSASDPSLCSPGKKDSERDVPMASTLPAQNGPLPRLHGKTDVHVLLARGDPRAKPPDLLMLASLRQLQHYLIDILLLWAAGAIGQVGIISPQLANRIQSRMLLY